MLCSSQAPGRFLARAEQDFLADMHQLRIALRGEYSEKYFTFPIAPQAPAHCTPPEPAEQEDPLVFRSTADMSREVWKGGAGPCSLNRGLGETLFPL